MNINIRSANITDAERIADILINTRKVFMPYAPAAHGDPGVRKWVKSQLVPSGGVTVATIGETIMGFLAISEKDGYGWIDQMYIDPLAVNQGIGGILLKHALENLPRPVRLYTFQENDGARRFYERHGFKSLSFSDGKNNEEHCPDVLYEFYCETSG
jgi:GNAT superfamily N-acetyltransferase